VDAITATTKAASAAFFVLRGQAVYKARNRSKAAEVDGENSTGEPRTAKSTARAQFQRQR
jgi:hypothetical protein